jgi:hypothetical protein
VKIPTAGDFNQIDGGLLAGIAIPGGCLMVVFDHE